MTLIPQYRFIVSGATLYFAIIFSDNTDSPESSAGPLKIDGG
jgi:hypothetical protein